jgi:Holliday junction resolvase
MRDKNEGPIVQALEQCGVQCWRLSGPGCPDLLTYWQGKYLPLEIKNPQGLNRTTEAQRDIPWPVVRSIEEALVWIGVKA